MPGDEAIYIKVAASPKSRVPHASHRDRIIRCSLKTDPARFEVVKNALTCAAEEMKIVLAKTAYSPLLKVAGDYSCGIFDIHGNMVAQGPDLPIHLGSMPDAVRAVVQAFPDVAPGDVFIHNDPYQGGSHLPDVNVVAPAFHEDRLLGFGCVRAHWPDIGSATPGSYGAVTEIYGEGLRLPPIRLYRDGKPDPAIEAIIFANVRTPTERLGDLRAQVGGELARRGTACRHWRRNTAPTRCCDIMQEVQDYSETMMRAALARAAGRRGRIHRHLRRRRRHRAWRDRRRTVHREAAHHQARRHDHRRLHRLRSAGRRADERAADRDRVGRVLRAEDDRRSEEPDPAEFRLLASGDGDRAAGLAW